MIFQEVVELRHDLLQIRDLIALIVMVYSWIDKIVHAMSLEVFFKFYERCLAIPIIFFFRIHHAKERHQRITYS